MSRHSKRKYDESKMSVLISGIYLPGRFSVDISFNQTNGVAAGHMINRFLRELPALRALVLVIKSFLNQRSMNEVFSGGLGSYSIVCLAVSFLQVGLVFLFFGFLWWIKEGERDLNP